MISSQIEGVNDLGLALGKLKKKVQQTIGLEAVAIALTPVAESARRHARNSRDTGNLEESIGLKLKGYARKSRVFGIVGPRHGFKKKDPSGKGYRIASKYGHLVEFGTSHSAAKPFMRPAWQENKDKIAPEMGAHMGRRITEEGAKIYKRRAKK